VELEPFLSVVEELIAIPSTADRPGELGRALELVLDLVGPGFVVERFESNGKPSALVYRDPERPEFRVILNAHLDVVPAQPAQLVAVAGDDCIGVGDVDVPAAAAGLG